VKDIKTTTHNTNNGELVESLTRTPRTRLLQLGNGEPAEVETEWRILQTEFANAGNPRAVLGVCRKIYRAR